jgi:hypothetical protein
VKEGHNPNLLEPLVELVSNLDLLSPDDGGETSFRKVGVLIMDKMKINKVK